jgi:CheY-like chemotaxis protein
LEAADGREALQLLYGNGAVQLIVCDIEMPRMNGFEFLQCRRADERLAQIPVVMLTAQDSDRHRQLATLLGANAYLAKPWNDAALLAEIATLLHPPVSATA